MISRNPLNVHASTQEQKLSSLEAFLTRRSGNWLVLRTAELCLSGMSKESETDFVQNVRAGNVF